MESLCPFYVQKMSLKRAEVDLSIQYKKRKEVIEWNNK